MKKITFPKKLSYITSYKPLHWVTAYLVKTPTLRGIGGLLFALF